MHGPRGENMRSNSRYQITRQFFVGYFFVPRMLVCPCVSPFPSQQDALTTPLPPTTNPRPCITHAPVSPFPFPFSETAIIVVGLMTQSEKKTRDTRSLWPISSPPLKVQMGGRMSWGGVSPEASRNSAKVKTPLPKLKASHYYADGEIEMDFSFC